MRLTGMFAAVSLMFAGAVLVGQTAQDHNAKGYRLYAEKDYLGAVEAFTNATVADPKFKFAFYNLACTYSLMLDDLARYSKEEIQGPDHAASITIQYTEAALANLGKAMALDRSYMGKSLNDKDLAAIRTCREYYLMIGIDFSDLLDALFYINQISLFSLPGEGIYDPIYEYEFSPDGTFVSKSGYFDKTDYRTPGTWYLEKIGKEILIKLSYGTNPYGLVTDEAVLTTEGNIKLRTFNILDEGIRKMYRDREFITGYVNWGWA